MAGGDASDRDAILYGERLTLPRPLRQRSSLIYDWRTYPLMKDTRKLGLDAYAFRDWAYAGIGSCWCGGADWAVDLGGYAKDDCQDLFPGNTIFDVEGVDVSYEDAPLGPLRASLNAAVRSHRQALPCELALHLPDLKATPGSPLTRPRIEVHYQMEERDYVEQASLAVIQTIEALSPENVRLDWRFIPREAKLVAYDARYDKPQGLAQTRALQSEPA